MNNANKTNNATFDAESSVPMPSAEEIKRLVSAANTHALCRDFSTLSIKVKKKPLALFFGRETFSDNTKYLFLSCARNKPDFDFMWCTWNQDLHSTLLQNNLPSFFLGGDIKITIELMLEASVAVFCENPWTAFKGIPFLKECLAGAKLVQLWHGVSVKHLDLMLIPRLNVLDNNFRSAICAASTVDYLSSSSSRLDGFWQQAFGIQNLLRVGQPRNEVILRDPFDLEYIGSMLSDSEAKKFESSEINILVAPTWQRGNPTWLTTGPFYAALEAIGNAHNFNFFLKLHPFLRGQVQENIFHEKFKRITFLDAGLDIYPWLKIFSALITDYSSIMFDYILTGNPVLTYEINEDSRLPFEPDFSLVPDIPFSYKFQEKTLTETLLSALNGHSLRQAQNDMASAIYETEPLQSSKKLLTFIAKLTHETAGKRSTIIDI